MIRVVNTTDGSDLTERITGLRWSNVRPGGDESASFTFHSPWYADNPEIRRKSTLAIMDGVDVLWQGRIEEHDRGADDQETIEVTAYGMGALLKDSTIAEIYVDQDLASWTDPSTQRKLDLVSTYALESPSVAADETTGEKALVCQVGPKESTTRNGLSEALYDAKGIVIGSIYYAWKKSSNINPGNDWVWAVAGDSADTQPSATSSGNLKAAGPGTGTLALGSDNVFGFVDFYRASSTALDETFLINWTRLAVYGNHGLAKQGTESATTAKGFFASQVIADVVGRVPGMTVRRNDATTYVIRQLEFKDPVSHEDAVTDANAFDQDDRIWGTWGPAGVFDQIGTGYFDYAATEPAVSHWFAFRSECDDLDLHSELSSLYNRAVVRYTDETGQSRTVARTTTVAELGSTTRTITIDGGNLTTEGAQALADTFLALSGGFAPARGSATFSAPVRHHQRGELPAHYMRADGANLRIPDVLPSTTLFALDTSPDRRTTFPIKKVEVNAGGEQIETTVELDQTNDWLAALQARLAAGTYSEPPIGTGHHN